MKLMDRLDGSLLCVCGVVEGELVEVVRNMELRMIWQQGFRGKKEWDCFCYDWGCGEMGDGGCWGMGGWRNVVFFVFFVVGGDVRYQILELFFLRCLFVLVWLSRVVLLLGMIFGVVRKVMMKSCE